MEKKGGVTIILAILGTVLVWFPILAPVLLSVAAIIKERPFRFDYLMPAELFPAALVGGVCSRGQHYGHVRARNSSAEVSASL
jgi:hypothetical protein